MLRYLKHIVSAVLFFVLSVSGAGVQAAGPAWHAAGYGGGGRFTAVAVDMSDPQTLYVGSDVAGIFRSRDGGNHFELIGKGLKGFAVADIAVNPAPPHEVVALTDDGLYYSVNRGDNWMRLSGEIRYPSRFFGSRLLQFTRASLWIGTDSKGVFRIPLSNLKAAPQPVRGLEPNKVNGLAVYDGYLYAGTASGVFRLERQKWEPQLKGLAEGSREITDIASSRNAIYIVEKLKGLYRLNAQTLSWENRPVLLQPLPKGYKSLLVHPGNPNLVFISSHPENWPHLLYKTQDGGFTWKSLDAFKVDPEAPPNWTSALAGMEEMAFVPGNSQNIFLTDWWNVWKSSDNGENWLQKHFGLQNTVVNDLKFHPQNRQIIYLCAADNGLMISEDGGRHWRRSMNGVADGHAQEIEISPQNPSRMFLLMNPWGKRGRVYLYESRDAGATWKDIGFPVPVETLAKKGYVNGLATNVELDPFAEDTIYVGTNGYGVYKTENSGRNWAPVNRGLVTPFIKGPGALLVHPKSNKTLFAATQEGGIFRSTDGADFWQSVTTGKEFVFGMAIDPSDPSRILAGAAGNTLLTSSDEGKSWREIRLAVSASPQMAVYSVAFHPRRAGLVLAGTVRYDLRATEGLFISTDGAKTFRRAPMDITRVNINAIAFPADQTTVGYVGFNGTGLFRIDLGENP